MGIAENMLGIKSFTAELKDVWRVEFEGGFVIEVPFLVNKTRDHAIMSARKLLAEQNRYNFDARRASGGRVVRCYRDNKYRVNTIR